MIPEQDLLEAGKYPWLEGHPLLLVLQASYEHHEEHLHPLLLAWLRQQPRQQWTKQISAPSVQSVY